MRIEKKLEGLKARVNAIRNDMLHRHVPLTHTSRGSTLTTPTPRTLQPGVAYVEDHHFENEDEPEHEDIDIDTDTNVNLDSDVLSSDDESKPPINRSRSKTRRYMHPSSPQNTSQSRPLLTAQGLPLPVPDPHLYGMYQTYVYYGYVYT
jgi:hypothetical protein